jgi:hypothetical protein
MTPPVLPASPAARPLRLRPTLAGTLVALAFGSLSLGSLCAMSDDMVASIGPGVGWLMIVTIWVTMAACIYGANQAWIGRDRAERFEAFGACLGVALLPLGLAFVLVASVSVHLGWRP